MLPGGGGGLGQGHSRPDYERQLTPRVGLWLHSLSWCLDSIQMDSSMICHSAVVSHLLVDAEDD